MSRRHRDCPRIPVPAMISEGQVSQCPTCGEVVELRVRYGGVTGLWRMSDWHRAGLVTRWLYRRNLRKVPSPDE